MGNMRKFSDRIPAPLIFVGSGLSQYSGAAIATVWLFNLMSPTTVAWWRITIAAVILVLIRRPFHRNLTWRQVAAATVLGIFIATMNMTFYQAISRIPLGTCVSIEFVGPVVVALFRGRGWGTRIAAILAGVGVASISGIGLDISTSAARIGLAFSIAAGFCWAGYIVVGQKLAAAGHGQDALAMGLFIAAILTVPLVGLSEIAKGWQSGWILFCCIAVGVLCTALPFPLEQVALRRLGPDIFSLLACLMPAISELVTMIALRHLPNVGEIVGLLCISLAVAFAQYRPGMLHRESTPNN
ncbi:EamA family transporter [Varibaculum vaginae]|uniref:EamA family transporter n=1 Tax=Varibaculum vaginae TaxID=2364797 RepID=UPI000F096F84|nr:EamA family transporter [Varibaculum vaginae]